MEGLTVDLLKDYLSKLPWNSSNCSDARKTITDFTGVGGEQIRAWYTGTNSPKGEILIRVRYFLETQGYKVRELSALKPEFYALGKILAYWLMDLEQIVQELGYASAKQVYLLMHGKSDALAERKEKVLGLIERFKDVLDLNKPKQLTLFENPPLIEKTAVIAGETTIQQMESCPENEPEEIQRIISALEILKHTISLLNPKLKHLLSDACTPDLRQMLRTKAGTRLVFDLSNENHELNVLLNALCSERARTQIQKKGKEDPRNA